MIARILFACLGVLLATQPGFTQSVIPEKQFAVTRNVDLVGRDLTSIFETTYKACSRACLADQNCQAFT